MKICPKCDSQNANTAPVCKNCGANLNETPTVEDPSPIEEKPPYHLNLCILFLILSFGISSCKTFLPINFDPLDKTDPLFIIYLCMIAFGILFLVLSFRCLKGVLKKRPVPGKGIFLIMCTILVSILIVFDIFSTLLLLI